MSLKEIENFSDATLKSMDPEWPANTFAGAFLCKPDIVQGMKIYDIETQCRVSNKAAEAAYRYSHHIPYDKPLTMDDFADWSQPFAMCDEMSQLWNEIEQGDETE